MINAGTVGAYLELDISQFRNNLTTAGRMLEQFRSEKESAFNDNSIAAALLDALAAPMKSVGKAAADLAGVFGRAMSDVREDARVTGSVIGGMGTGFRGVSDAAADLCSDIRSALQKLPDNAEKCIQASCTGMKNKLVSAGPALYAAARQDGSSIVNAFDRTLGSSGGLSAIGNKAVISLSRGMDSKKNTAVASINGIMRGMLTAAERVKFTGIGSSVVSGIARGMNAGKSGLMATAASIASGIAHKIKAVLKINSPSKVTQEIGYFTARGMELGITEREGDLYEAGSAAAASLEKGIADNTGNAVWWTDAFTGKGRRGNAANTAQQGMDTRWPHRSEGCCDTVSVIPSDTAASLSGISLPVLPVAGTHSTDFGDRLDRLLYAVEKLADSQTTMEIDGRSFGRMVREYVPR